MTDNTDRDRALADLAGIMLADLEQLQAAVTAALDAQAAVIRESLTAFRDVALVGAR